LAVSWWTTCVASLHRRHAAAIHWIEARHLLHPALRVHRSVVAACEVSATWLRCISLHVTQAKVSIEPLLHPEHLLFRRSSSSLSNWVMKPCFCRTSAGSARLPRRLRYSYVAVMGAMISALSNPSSRLEPVVLATEWGWSERALSRKRLIGASAAVSLSRRRDVIGARDQTRKIILLHVFFGNSYLTSSIPNKGHSVCYKTFMT
jgi:hypothetical protein